MKALAWHGKSDMRCDNVPDPKIEHPRDAIIKVTTCAMFVIASVVSTNVTDVLTISLSEIYVGTVARRRGDSQVPAPHP